MKAIDLSTRPATLEEVLLLAGEDNVVLTTSEGRRYVLAEIDDFVEEGRAVLRNPALVQLLDERSKEEATISLSQVREQVLGKKKQKGQPPKTRK